MLRAGEGAERQVQAGALVNAAGRWVKPLPDEALGIRVPACVRLVKGSHIVVPRIPTGGCCS